MLCVKNFVLKKRLLGLLVLSIIFSCLTLCAAQVRAADDSIALTVCGDGVEKTVEFTLADLEALPQASYSYSGYNHWPSLQIFEDMRGPTLKTILDAAGLKDNATFIRVKLSDDVYSDFSKAQLLDEARYYFPDGEKDEDNLGKWPPDRSEKGKQAVETMIALNRGHGKLIYGQCAINEPTCCKNQMLSGLCRGGMIEVLTRPLEQWDAPQADVAPGMVTAGTKVTIQHGDGTPYHALVYYTLDGSEPGYGSSIANVSYPNFQPDLNKAIAINKSLTIKTKTIGMGKLDSEVVTYQYRVENELSAPLAKDSAEDTASSQAAVVDEQALPTGGAAKTPPVLLADTNLNVINKPVELTFSDDKSWREAISSVSVDGVALDSEKYSIGVGKITIDKSMFRSSKDYSITVKANGYADAGIRQMVGLLCITGDGVAHETVFTRAELEAMQQERAVFSATNDFPMDFLVAAEGIPLQVLLEYAGIKAEASILSFMAADGFRADFTVDELLRQKRYIFPDKTEAGPLLALKRMEHSADFAEMTGDDTPVLCMGQRAATEQTVLTFVKLINIITVTNESLQRWEEPTAKIIDPVSGQKIEMSGAEVRKDSQLVLRGNPKCKIYYTTDGSEPDLDSRIYNAHGCGPMAGMDEPIVIEADTTIKAKAVWPGKVDSEIAVFSFAVSDEPGSEFSQKGQALSTGSLTFTDIQNSWAKEDIEMLASKGLITGKSSNSYEPEAKISRAEFAALLVRALALQEKVLEEGQFEDVSAADWYAGSVAAASAQNIISGYDGRFFKPNKNISREEMTVMIIRAARAAGKEDSLSLDEEKQQLVQFEDRQMISSWAEHEAALTVKAGIIKGMAAGQFSPQTDVDRAQSAAILKRFLNYADLIVDSTGESQKF